MCKRTLSYRRAGFSLPFRRPFLTGTLLIGILFATSPAQTYEFEPISLIITGSIQPGDPLACHVSLTGKPDRIHIYSSPPGIVAYDGSVSAAQDTVYATTAPNAPSGPVTVILTVDGNSAVGATTVVE
jgi:hypothetical protein